MRGKKPNCKKNYLPFIWGSNLSCFILLISLVSCQTLLQSRSQSLGSLQKYRSGIFSGFVVIQTEKQKNSYFAVDIMISPSGRLRIDLITSLGFPFLTILLKKKESLALFFQSKQFYKGESFAPFSQYLFSTTVDFNVFTNILFDRKPSGQEWSCKEDQKGQPVQCQGFQTNISWKREGKQVISLTTSTFHFDFYPSSFHSEVKEQMFDIHVPKDFNPLSLEDEKNKISL